MGECTFPILGGFLERDGAGVSRADPAARATPSPTSAQNLFPPTLDPHQ